MAGGNSGKVGAALVVGGGIGGMQAALDLAESGIKVYLLDSSPAIGGVMAQLDKTFPTNDCAMCTMAPRLVQIGRHKDVDIITLAEVDRIRGEPGNFTVTINKKPRFVKEEKCTGCGTCAANCPVRNKIYTNGHEPEVQLDPETEAKIKPIVDQFRGQRGVLVPLLQDIQAAFRWLPEDVLRYASAELDIPLSLMMRTATFYKAFSLKPVGRHKITVCLGTTCHVKGAPKIIDTLEREHHIQTGQTTPDGNFTLEAVYCLGCCGLAPVLTVGEDLHGKLNQTKLPDIIGQYREAKVEVKVPVQVEVHAPARVEAKVPAHVHSEANTMPRITIEDLEKISGEIRRATLLREGAGRARVTVHMGTCGIAAGAREIMNTLLAVMDQKDVKDVILTTSGCAGLCSREPMATVEIKGQSPVKYVDLTPEKTRRIFAEHILGGNVVKEYALAIGGERMA